MSRTWGLALAASLVVGNGFFVAIEFALLAARRTALAAAADTSSRAARALSASQRLPLMIAGCQFGITLCSLGLGAVGEPAVSHVLEPPLEHVGVPDATVHVTGFVLALALVSALHMLLGEMVPKNLALAAPERSAILLSPLLLAFIAAFRPVLRALAALAALVLRPFHVALVDERARAYTPDQIAHLVDDARREGLLQGHEHQRVTEALAFDRATVQQVMVPREQVVSLPVGTTPEQLEDAVSRTGYSRFPLDQDSTWVGYVHLADALNSTTGRTRPLPSGRVRALPELPADLPLPAALTQLRNSGAHLAHVSDGTDSLGVVMLEDILEVLVGEVQDDAAHDPTSGNARPSRAAATRH